MRKFRTTFSIRNEKGQSLVEVLIALMIVALVLTTVAVAVILAIRSSRFSQHKARATFLAQEGAEWVRNQRSVLGWDGFLDKGGVTATTYCINALTFDQLGECPQGDLIDGEYAREVTITLGAPEPPPPDPTSKVRTTDVNVTVFWEEGAKEFSAEVETKLTMWDISN
ncbi:MAG: prepilin-type N-terminal cleavage/methylation domain-containing protein [Candidatus Chisholmbacteria bacterium]|nr:prepilin-type N-terminal cleavage/methylation domain-containing protein [Candidatus Chisholmbacteria bacterium]